MGNAFGNYPDAQAASASLEAEGFERRDTGYYVMRGMTQGSLVEPPCERVFLAEVVERRVSPEYGGVSYWQVHYL